MADRVNTETPAMTIDHQCLMQNPCSIMARLSDYLPSGMRYRGIHAVTWRVSGLGYYRYDNPCRRTKTCRDGDAV